MNQQLKLDQEGENAQGTEYGGMSYRNSQAQAS